MSKRIYFSGGTASGKSTLASLAADFTKLPLLPSATGTVRQQMGLSSDDILNDKRKAAEYQRTVLWTQAVSEFETVAFVSDRCLDCLAYTAMQCEPALVKELFASDVLNSHIRRMQQSNYLLFLCPPNKAAAANALHDETGRRRAWVDFEQIKKTFALCEYTYQILGLEYIVVPVGLKERQKDFVLEVIQRVFGG